MLTIKIDEKDYELDQLSDEAKAQLTNLQFVNAVTCGTKRTQENEILSGIPMVRFRDRSDWYH